MLEVESKPERRRWERVPIPVPVFVRGIDSEQRPFLEFATMTDINVGGALLILRHHLAEDAVLVLEVPSAKQQLVAGRRGLKARLVYASWTGGCYVAGLEFVEPLKVGHGLGTARTAQDA